MRYTAAGVNPHKQRESAGRTKKEEAGIELKRKIIRKELMFGLDSELQHVEHRMKHLYRGFLGSLLNPLAHGVFSFIAKEDIRRRGIKQIDLILDIAAAEADCGGGINSTVHRAVEKHLDEFLAVDEIWHRCNKDNGKISEMKVILKDAFCNRLDGVMRLMDGGGSDYVSLARTSFPNRSDLEALCRRQFELAEKAAHLIENERSLLRAPNMARKELIAVLKSVLKYGEKMINDRIDEIYPCGD